MSRALQIHAGRPQRLIDRYLAYLVPEKIPEKLVNLYDRFSREAFDKYYLEVAREIAAFRPRGRILDIGCGPGYLAIQIARLREEMYIDGVDLSFKMVSLAGKNAIDHGVEKRVKFRVGNANALDCPEGHYDMVLSTGVLHSLREPVRFFNECFRVLKPGGQAWIYDPAKITSGARKLPKDLGGRWAEAALFRAIILLAKLLRKENLSEAALHDLVERSLFPEYSLSVQGETRLKLKKR